MAAWSAEIANEFIRRAAGEGRALTQMQLQKLVYIAHGWTLAITGKPLTHDEPQAWDYGPVYKELWSALRGYGRAPITKEILNKDYMPGVFNVDAPDSDACASLTEDEINIIDRVFRDYSKFHAFQLSALTHKEGTPWTKVYAGGLGKFDSIENDDIKEHFVGIATSQAA